MSTRASGRAVLVMLASLLAVLSGGGAVQAQSWWESIQYGAPELQAGGIPVPSIATSLPHNGDPAGIRKWLGDRGVVYGLEYTNDILSNTHGGLRRGTIDQGKLQGILTVDLEKLAGLNGLSFFANFFQIHNTGRMRRDYVGGVNTIAAIEAVPTTRLSEVWFEQSIAGDKLNLRAGQLAADAEFFYSEISQLFLQSDWATISALNLPSGGPAYPLSTPGVRLRINPVKDVWLKLAVFNGDPAGPGTGDEQLRNRYGLNFRVRDPAFVIGEAEFQRNYGPKDQGLATNLKLGGWGHLGEFDDKRFADNGALLAGSSSSVQPLKRRGNSGLYAVIDQQLYRPKDGDSQSGISVYTRVSISPSDRNLIDRYIDGGIVFGGIIPKRPDDRFGVGVIYAKFSDGIRAFEQDQVNLGTPVTVQDHETNLEFTYQAQVIPGWTVQPVLTFVWHPNGQPARNATVAGVRSLWRY